MTSGDKTANIAIIGAGPAGLHAAEVLATAGQSVTVYDRKASVGRKFLMAGRGGLNLTHSEDFEIFKTRYGAAQGRLSPMLNRFTPENLRTWCEQHGEPTFIGSSGRIFPKSFKASPLLRSWISHLNQIGVQFELNKKWTAWDNGHITFVDKENRLDTVNPAATLLALGGASWPNLGSDGSWVEILQKHHVKITPLRPANCGFTVAWSPVFIEKFAGQPLKTITLSCAGHAVPGELMINRNGIEGGAIYALSSVIRTAIENHGETILNIDLRPALGIPAIMEKLAATRGRNSLSNHLQKTLNLSPAAIGLLREVDRDIQNLPLEKLAGLIKSAPIKVTAAFPIERAISTAGGIAFDALDQDLMIKNMPGVFAAGEMLDWEAPTGGYLLQAAFATGHAAAEGILRYLSK